MIYNSKYNLIMALNFFLRSTSLFILAIPLFIASCDKGNDIVADNTITGIVVAGSNFSTLETALLRANLQNTLQGTGPFTVFAPDDAAFAASGINAATINSLTPREVQEIYCIIR